MFKRKAQLALVLTLSLVSSFANAVPITASTGDLGNNVINEAGLFGVSLIANTPSNSLASSIDVKYGLWNSPNVLVSVFLNTSLIGSFLADQGYISPGPEFITFDVTGLLLNGLNTISFDGFGANSGDYVVGQVDLNYDNSGVSVPEPGSLVLLALGLGGLVVSRRKTKA